MTREQDKALLPALLARAFNAHPTRVAVTWRGREVTYAALSTMADQVAAALAARGAARGAIIAVLLEDRIALVAALLGVLRIGGIYAPLDPSAPPLRQSALVAELDPACLLTEPKLAPRARELLAAPGESEKVLEISDRLAAPTSPAPACAHAPGDPCYIFYTSGSTGRPKGIVGQLKGLSHFIRWEIETFHLGEGVRVSQFTAPTFDASLRDILVPLCAGGTLCVPPERPANLDPEALNAWIDESAIHLIHAVPSVLRAILSGPLHEGRFAALQRVLLAGEALQVADVARFRRVFGDRIAIVNLYGPTETTMVKFFHVVQGSDVDRGFIPIGKPMKGAAAILIDERGAVCPRGMAGEILIRTPFMTLGYFKDPALTASAFIPNPFGSDPKDLVYKTGDLARMLEDGTFQFIGRRDSQVKIRGIRVELGEIEAALSLHPAVREAVVTAPEDGSGARRLVAYVVPREAPPGTAPRPGELTGFLAERLPEAMIPRVYLTLDALPRTPTGKVDRRALPLPETESIASASTAPRSPIEALLAELWAEVLRVPRVGVHDDFFALGGHSLRATQVLARVHATLGVELPLRVMFDDATIAGMAARAEEALGGDASGRPPIERAPGSQGAATELSFGQERLWFLDQLEPGRADYNVSAAVELEGKLDARALAGAFAEIIRRHESLRTTFVTVDGRPVAQVGAAEPPALAVVDLRGAPAHERRSCFLAEASAEALRPFDLARGPLLRAKLHQLGEEAHALVVTMHHIVCDGWSMGILMRELAAIYGALARGLQPDLPELPLQYADYARWQRRWLTGEVLERQLAHFRAQLAGSPLSLDLPTDHPRPAVQRGWGGRQPIQIPAALTAALRELGRTEGATLFMTLLTALEVLLSRLSGQEDIVIGTPIANRLRAETEGLIGMFANTLVLRVDLSGQPSFRGALRRAREAALGAYAHQDAPFERLVEELRPTRDLGQHPLFQVMFALQDADAPPRALPGLTLRPLTLAGGTAKFDLELLMVETPEGLTGSLEYSLDLFEPATAARIAARFHALLEAVVRAPDTPCVDLPWLPEAELRLLEAWSTEGAPEDLPALGPSFLDLFEAQVARAPAAVAAVIGPARLSYSALDLRANRLARVLIGQGVGPEVLVALLAERSLEFLIAVLAIFKAGGAYLPLDPQSPGERLRRVVEQSGAPLVLATRALAAGLPRLGPGPRVLSLEEELARGAEASAPPRLGAPEGLAYVIFTSGSTGAPKGAMIAQRGMVNHLHAKIRALDLTAADAVAQTASQCFDISVWQLLSALAVGGQVHIYPDEVVSDGAALLDAIERDGISILETVPSQLRAMLLASQGPSLARLRWMIPTGEALPPELCRAWFERYPAVPLMNAYGPTECSDDVTHFPLRGPISTAVVPIGRPIPHLRMFVLDRRGHLQPLGVPGELYVGGVGVGRGYIHDPRRTIVAFVPDPFAAEVGARLYRTGDLVRWNAQGDLEYLGRLDHQVKIRGYRIELGEIEASLAEIPALQQSVVTVARDADGQPRLVAYVVPKAGRAGPPEPSEAAQSGPLKAYLKGKLPDYMIPATFVFLDALPLTPNGKIDRRALPPPEDAMRAGGPSASPVAPRDVVEETVASVWNEVLQVPSVSVHEDFFDLGGHSLLAMQVIARVRAVFGIDLPLRALFETRTVAGLAERILAAKREDTAPHAPVLGRIAREGYLPLSFGQERLWFLEQLGLPSPLYNVPVAVRLTGRLDVLALERSLAEVIRRHEVLRTTFPRVEGRPRLALLEAPEIALPRVDLRGHPAAEREQVALAEAAQAAAEPFDLGRGPLLCARLFQLDNEEHVLLLCLHHVIVDGWSLGVLLRELGALYDAHGRQVPSPLDELPIQFVDYAAWQRRWLQGEELERKLAHFRHALAGAPATLALPADRPRPRWTEARGGRRSFTLPAALTSTLLRLGREEGATLYMVLLAAFASLLCRYAAEDDLVVGTPIANRTHPATEALIGPFVNTLPLRIDLSGSPSFREAIGRVKAVALGVYAHQDLPFERLVEELRPARLPGQSPIFQVLFALQNAPLPALELPGLTLTPLDLEGGPARFDLSLVMAERQGSLAGSLQFNADLFDDATMRRLLEHFCRLLAEASAAPDASLQHLSLLSEEERGRVTALASGPRTTLKAPARWAHERIAEQAARHPDAVAAACGEASISYRALDQQSNQLARLLARRGVRPGEVVGLAVPRSIAMLVGILGVLKAGAAYLPLDPASPAERRAFMVADAKVALVITQGERGDALPFTAATRLCLDAEAEALRVELPSPLEVRVLPDDLAYVIYTSGSTGAPKGALLTHRGLLNLVCAQIDAFALDPSSRVLQVASPSFDAAVSEVFTTLVAGGTLLFADTEESILAGDALLEHLREEAVTAVTLPPSVLATLPPADLPALRTLVCAGEACPGEVIAPWLPGRRVLNAYGPTEATVCATIAVCTGEDPTPPIGRPIANVDVYVLDPALRPVPIGAPGEIYLGGPGLARGYLGKPALTAERFLPHPFSSEPGARLYRTGDLARHRADGQLIYLGRRDAQVKVRGYRIELGEIEAALLSHPDVQEAAVVLHADTERLIAHVVPRASAGAGALALSSGALRGLLHARLPEPMIPAAFVVVPELPRTSSGKLDRRALTQRQALPARAEGAPVAPRSATERRLIEVWEQVLSARPIGVTDNFFDLGGHSLLAVRLMSAIESAFAVKLPLARLFADATIEGLAAALEASPPADPARLGLDLCAEAVLDPAIAIEVRGPLPEELARDGKILLTGATGFVGAFVLYELLQQTRAQIYCLVRAVSLDEGRRRIGEALRGYALPPDSNRIVPVLGDLAEPRLGLTPDAFDALAAELSAIFHSGARVHFFEPYARLKAANVLGTEEVLRLALRGRVKPVHYISTLSVFSPYYRGKRVTERDEPAHVERLAAGYEQSKWVAERLCLIARARGAPVTIYRPGAVTGHSETGEGPRDDLISRMLQGCLALGSAPDLPAMVDMTPVDHVSRAVVTLALRPGSSGGTFHIANPAPMSLLDIERRVAALGYPLVTQPVRAFRERLVRAPNNPLTPLLSLFDDDVETQGSAIQFDCKDTLSRLAESGIQPPPGVRELLELYLARLVRAGLISPPEPHLLAARPDASARGLGCSRDDQGARELGEAKPHEAF